MRHTRLFCAIFTTIVGLAAFTNTADAQNVTLPTPQKDATDGSLLKALQARRSVRQFSDKALTDQQLSDLLWAACGINRSDGHLTIPTARNRQEITVYIGKSDGTYRYDAKTNALIKVGSSDLRREVSGRNTFIQTAPVVLAVVSDTSLQGGNMSICGIDVGAVMQNVYLHCAANGLATVCCYAGEDTGDIQKFLGCKTEMKPLIYMPIGYAE